MLIAWLIIWAINGAPPVFFWNKWAIFLAIAAVIEYLDKRHGC